mgnify:CR=1 FL=1
MLLKTRFSNMVNNMNDYSFHILGCGAIGSSTATQLVRTGAENFYLYDMDTVSIENVGVSEYFQDDIGHKKVDALKNHIKAVNNEANIEAINGRFERLEESFNSIVVLGFDSMLSRLEAMESICKNKAKPLLIIDGRMGAEQFQQYMFKNPTLSEYKKNWYSDESGDPEPCTAKATSYCSNMSGSFIVNSIRKFITDQPYDKKLLFHFPSMFLEIS